MSEAHIYIDSFVNISPSILIQNGTEVKSETIIFKDFIRELYKMKAMNYPKFFKMDDLSKLGFLAAELLCETFDRTNIANEDIAILLSNAESTLDTDKKFFESIDSLPSPAVFVYTLPNIMIGEISIKHLFKGENYFFITPQFDAEFIYQQVSLLFTNTTTKACICGWVDLKSELDYSAKLCLVNKFESKNKSINFTAQNLKNIF